MAAITKSRAKNITRAVLARQTGTSLSTIRYYEDIGIITIPRRAANGYRIYDQQHISQLVFVRRSRELGFSLDQIQSLLKLTEDSTESRCDVRDLAVSHHRDIKIKIADLQAMDAALKEMISSCESGNSATCPILDSLSRDIT